MVQATPVLPLSEYLKRYLPYPDVQLYGCALRRISGERNRIHIA